MKYNCLYVAFPIAAILLVISLLRLMPAYALPLPAQAHQCSNAANMLSRGMSHSCSSYPAFVICRVLDCLDVRLIDRPRYFISATVIASAHCHCDSAHPNQSASEKLDLWGRGPICSILRRNTRITIESLCGLFRDHYAVEEG